MDISTVIGYMYDFMQLILKQAGKVSFGAVQEDFQIDNQDNEVFITQSRRNNSALHMANWYTTLHRQDWRDKRLPSTFQT